MQPAVPGAVLDEMTWGELVAFHTAALNSGPPPLLQALAAMLDGRALPCAEPCEHPECPLLAELWDVKEKLVALNPLPPSPEPAPSPTALDSSTTSPPAPTPSDGPTST